MSGTPGSRGARTSRLSAVLLTAFLAATAVGALHHEPHRDEAQKWLLARDIPSLGEFVRILPFEGSFAAWPLALLPLAKAGLPWQAMLWLNWVCIGGAAAVLALRAPFHPLLKLLFLASYYPLYEYGVIARNYSVTAAALFLLLALQPSWRRRPRLTAALLALLGSSSIFGAAFAAALGALFLADLRRSGRPRGVKAVAGALLAAGAVLTLAQIAQSRAAGTIAIQMAQKPELRGVARAFNYGLLYHETYLWTATVPVAGIVLLGLLLPGLLRRPRALWFAAVSFSALVYISLRTVTTGPRIQGFIPIALVASIWLGRIEMPRPPRGLLSGPVAERAQAAALTLCAWLLGASLALGAKEGLRLYVEDFRYPFSGGEHIARYIREHGLAGLKLAAHPAGKATAVLVHFPDLRAYYPGADRTGTYVVQDEGHFRGRDVPLATVVARAFAKYRDEETFLLLLDEVLPPAALGPGGFPCRPLAALTANIVDESFFLYACESRRRSPAPAPSD